MRTSLPRRQLGALGERLAADHLAARGYRVVDRNFRTRYGELDLVAEGGGCLVFCEVKTRVAPTRGPFTPLSAVGGDKRRRVRAMACQWLAAAAPRPRCRELRFDAIGVTVTPAGALVALEHLEGAFW